MQNKIFHYLSTSIVLVSTVLGTTLVTGIASAATISRSKNTTKIKHTLVNKTKKKPVVISGLSGMNTGAEGGKQEEGAENAGQQNSEKNLGMRRGSGVSGTVSAVNGTSFTITMQGRGRNMSTSTPVVYTINTDSNTIFMKDHVTSTLADVAVGQRVMTVGSVDKTTFTVTATKVSINTKPMIKPTINGANLKGRTKKGMHPKK